MLKFERLLLCLGSKRREEVLVLLLLCLKLQKGGDGGVTVLKVEKGRWR
jgi:hypothetical protein